MVEVDAGLAVGAVRDQSRVVERVVAAVAEKGALLGEDGSRGKPEGKEEIELHGCAGKKNEWSGLGEDRGLDFLERK